MAGGWAVAAEAAYAAAVALAAVDSCKPHAPLGLVSATLAPAAGKHFKSAATLSATVNAQSGSIDVSADNAVLLSTSEAMVAESSAAVHAPVQQQRRFEVLPAAVLARASVAGAEAAAAALAAPPSLRAQQLSGLFLQPTLLHAASQLLQLPEAADSNGEPQPAEPTAFGLLLPGMAIADRKARNTYCHRMWRADATKHSLQLRSDTAGCSLALHGMQQRLLTPSKWHSTAIACSATPVADASYAAVWQVVEPVATPDPRLSTAGAFRPFAILSFGTLNARRVSSNTPTQCSKPQRRTAASLHGCTGRGGDIGQVACFCGTQLLQTAAMAGESSFALSTATPAATACPVPQSNSVNIATCSAALHAMLRCAATELVAGARCTASSINAAAPSGLAAATHGAAAWDATYNCHGQQFSSGIRLAGRLLPAAMFKLRRHARSECAGQAWAVSGGTGALGMLTAGWLEQHQVAAVLLLGRNGCLRSDAPQELLEKVDGCLMVRMCDAAMHSDTTAASASQALPLVGLLHAGGVLQDAALQQQTAAGIRAVHAPKTAGLRRVLDGVAAAPLQQALLFSSIAAVTGPAGSTNYAAANSALDAAAECLQLEGEIAHACWLLASMLGRDSAGSCISS